MIRKCLSMFGAIGLIFILASCTNSSEPMAPEPTTKSIFPTVSPMDFRIAALNHTITQSGDVSVIALTNSKDFYVGTPKSQAAFSLFITKTSETGNWKPMFASVYKGKKWIFHDSVEISSTTGEFTISSLDKEREDKVQNNGTVSEMGLSNPTDVEVERYCAVIAGSNAKMHIWDLSGNTRGAIFNIPETDLKFLQLTCQIYAGTTQGLKVEDYDEDFQK